MAGEHQYRIYGRRLQRRRWPYAAGAVLLVLAALVAWQVLAVPRVSAVTPGPGAFVNQPALEIVLKVKGLSKLEGVRVAFDNVDVSDSAAMNGDRLSFAVSDLDDGEHTVTFRATSSNVLRRDVREYWRFTVDTSVPTLELEGSLGAGQINTSPATFTGLTEPYATVEVRSGTVAASGAAGADGKYSVAALLPDGPSSVVLTIVDRAGNSMARTLDVYVDAVPPTLSVSTVPSPLETAKLVLRVTAADQLGSPRVVVELDGKRQRMTRQASELVLKKAKLAQGEHTVVVTVSDKGGNTVTERQDILVDSSEKFGSEPMWMGARGNDVGQLQKRLIDLGVYSGKRTRVYDRQTAEAVKKYQAEYGFTADGRVDGDTLTALGGRIVIDLGELRLYLYNGDKVYKTYRVATGQSAYPTPTGQFAIVNKQVDPTWVPPPDAEWAKGAKPIPPGPGNPLGTRWIGLNYPGVGIHGTSDDSSIGTYASHGCIRMHTYEVERLYSMVVVGMPVTIRY